MNFYDKSNLKYNHSLVNPTIIDIGANIGIESIRLNQIYPHSDIILVEPQKENCDRIRQYIKENKLDSWKVSECAIDLVEGRKEFGFHTFEQDGRLNGSLEEFNFKKWNYEGKKLVDTKRLENICSNPDILKIDIERYEYIVLSEIVKILSIKIMYVELHGPCYELNIIDFLNNCLKDTGLEVTGWYYIQQQAYSVGETIKFNKLEPQEHIGCGNDCTVIIERTQLENINVPTA